MPDATAARDGLEGLPTWDLGDLYASIDSPALAADIDLAASEAQAFEARWKGRLADAAGQTGENGLGAVMTAFEALEERIGRIVSYAGLVFAGDMADPRNAKFYGDVQARMTDASSHLVFFTLELNRLADAVVDRAFALDERFAHFRPWVLDARKERPYQLEDRVEQLFHEKSVTGHGAWNRLFDETMAELRFAVGGSELALEATLHRLQDPDEAERRAAAEALAAVFARNIRLFTLITNTLARDKEISDRWRGFADVADARHLSNRVDRATVDALAAAVREAYPRLSHRYYAMKTRWLSKDRLDYWDRNAPLPDAPAATIGWGEARHTVIDAFGSFSPKMSEIAERFFARNWIDAPARPGKAPGAFAHPTVPSSHPYVLLNYLGRPRDVMTLAHELGHGVHQVLAGRQGALMASTPLTLAETASVFGEMLTFRSLLEKATDPLQRKAMLAQKVEDMINTVVRQIAFYAFERKVHEERRSGELTAERIGELWMSVQAESLGPSVRLGPGYENFWCYVPHFIHSPFYVYAYAFGDCLVNSLYAVYRSGLPGFEDRYFDMLSAGGSRPYDELIASFGLNPGDPDFWAHGLSMISDLIDELELLDTAK